MSKMSLTLSIGAAKYRANYWQDKTKLYVQFGSIIRQCDLADFEAELTAKAILAGIIQDYRAQRRSDASSHLL